MCSIEEIINNEFEDSFIHITPEVEKRLQDGGRKMREALRPPINISLHADYLGWYFDMQNKLGEIEPQSADDDAEEGVPPGLTTNQHVIRYKKTIFVAKQAFKQANAPRDGICDQFMDKILRNAFVYLPPKAYSRVIEYSNK